MRGERPVPPAEIPHALLRYDAIPGGGSNVVMHRTAWQRVGPFDERLKGGEDWEMWIRLAKHGLPACVYSPLVARRLHDTNATLDVAAMMRGIQLIEVLHHIRVEWGQLHRWMAHSHLRGGRRRAALAHFVRAALHGQIRAVAADLAVIVSTAVVRRGPMPPAGSVAPDGDEWTATAAAWLDELQTNPK
jgi:hypothetical protein